MSFFSCKVSPCASCRAARRAYLSEPYIPESWNPDYSSYELDTSKFHGLRGRLLPQSSSVKQIDKPSPCSQHQKISKVTLYFWLEEILQSSSEHLEVWSISTFRRSPQLLTWLYRGYLDVITFIIPTIQSGHVASGRFEEVEHGKPNFIRLTLVCLRVHDRHFPGHFDLQLRSFLCEVDQLVLPVRYWYPRRRSELETTSQTIIIIGLYNY